jgi:hypothetical protein
MFRESVQLINQWLARFIYHCHGCKKYMNIKRTTTSSSRCQSARCFEDNSVTQMEVTNWLGILTRLLSDTRLLSLASETIVGIFKQIQCYCIPLDGLTNKAGRSSLPPKKEDAVDRFLHYPRCGAASRCLRSIGRRSSPPGPWRRRRRCRSRCRAREEDRVGGGWGRGRRRRRLQGGARARARVSCWALSGPIKIGFVFFFLFFEFPFYCNKNIYIYTL